MENTNLSGKSKPAGIVKEFFRYLFVGGSAFAVDTAVLVLTRNFLFYDIGKTGIMIAAALGFTAGLLYNYVLSVIFVFENASSRVKGNQGKAFLLFVFIGIIGLFFTEAGMYLGITFLGSQYYLIIKIFVSATVLFWNYGARKLFIFG